MARILSDETTLTRKRTALARENRMLRILVYIESGLAVLMLMAGLVIWFFNQAIFLFVLSGVAAFFALGHFFKIRQNKKEQGSLEHGIKGESEVTKLLNVALGNDTYLFNDLNIKHGRHRSQIDHLVISPRGIFVIETKNWRGDITGDEKEPRWQQVRNPGDNPIHVSNPIEQNRRHVETLAGFLKAKKAVDMPIHSVIVSTRPGTSFKVTNQTVPILRPDPAAVYIADFKADRLFTESELDSVINLLMKATS